MSDTTRFALNGEAVESQAGPMARLLDVLRTEFRLTGTKEGCGEGECGACSVLVDGTVVCACLVPMVQIAGRSVETIEGIAHGVDLDPLQEAFISEGGVQCGACTPGMVLTARAFLDKNPNPDHSEIREHLAGNLCRCTGYVGIYRAMERVIADMQGDAS